MVYLLVVYFDILPGQFPLLNAAAIHPDICTYCSALEISSFEGFSMAIRQRFC